MSRKINEEAIVRATQSGYIKIDGRTYVIRPLNKQDLKFSSDRQKQNFESAIEVFTPTLN